LAHWPWYHVMAAGLLTAGLGLLLLAGSAESELACT
jgi:hypothetical protein